LPYSLLALGRLGGLRLLRLLTGHDDCLTKTLQIVKLTKLIGMFSSFPLSARQKKKKEKTAEDIKGGQSGAIRDCSADFLHGIHVTLVP
jgi:hypothetical protein